jgi:hypothetical protein
MLLSKNEKPARDDPVAGGRVRCNSVSATAWWVPDEETRLLNKKPRAWGRSWQQGLDVLKDWSYAAKRKRAHTNVRKQAPMLIL